MKTNSLFVLALSSLVLLSCKKDEDKNTLNIPPTNRIIKNNFEGRITYFDNEIPALEDGSGKRNKNSSFTHVADVSSPVINGATLSATGVNIQGNLAYVTYHWNGAENDYAGAIEVINITNPSQPTLVSGLYFTDTDLNEIEVQGNKAYVVGGRDIDKSGYNTQVTSGAILEEVSLTNGGLLTNNTQQTWVPGFSANSVFRKNQNLLVASGNTGGGVFQYSLHPNNYLNLTESDFYSNSKFGVDEGSQFVFLEGGPNVRLHVHNSNNFNPASKTVANLSAQQAPLDGKAVLRIHKKKAYVSGGQFGLFVYDMNNLNSTPVGTYNTNGNGDVNGVHVDNFFVYVAKGSEGVHILDVNTLAPHTLFTFNGSANYVYTRDNSANIFVAHGRDGLKILKKSNNGK